jgi:hypothetical protein
VTSFFRAPDAHARPFRQRYAGLMFRRWCKVLPFVFNPAAAADKVWSRVLKILLLLGVGGPLTGVPSSLSIPSRIASATAAMFILALWGCYRLQRQIDISDFEWIVKPTSRMKLASAPGGGWKLDAYLSLGFRNSTAVEVILKSFKIDLIHKAILHERIVDTEHIAAVMLNEGGNLVKIEDITIRSRVTELQIMTHNRLPPGLNPSDLDRRYQMRITLDIVGYPNHIIDWSIRWSQAILSLDPESFYPTGTSTNVRLRRPIGG